jgi:hypothetical protein
MAWNWDKGPNGSDQAAAMARTSQNQSPTFSANTSTWSFDARQAYYRNGGR